ncbi:10280_t:CDS:1, partial [Scutellospora calospora]
MNPNVCSHISTLLSTSPMLKNFSNKEKLLPIGEWAGKIGEIASQNLYSSLYALRGILCRVLEGEKVIRGCCCSNKENHCRNGKLDDRNTCQYENENKLKEYDELVKE